MKRFSERVRTATERWPESETIHLRTRQSPGRGRASVQQLLVTSIRKYAMADHRREDKEPKDRNREEREREEREERQLLDNPEAMEEDHGVARRGDAERDLEGSCMDMYLSPASYLTEPHPTLAWVYKRT